MAMGMVSEIHLADWEFGTVGQTDGPLPSSSFCGLPRLIAVLDDSSPMMATFIAWPVEFAPVM